MSQLLEPGNHGLGLDQATVEGLTDGSVGVKFRLLRQVSCDQPPFADHAPPIGVFKAGQDAQKGRFSATVAADNPDLLPLGHGQGSAGNDPAGTIAFFQAGYVDDVHFFLFFETDETPGLFIHPGFGKAKAVWGKYFSGTRFRVRT
ncbi:MAG: hypothetical protein P8Z70_04355 [Desulfuromonadales bacterium]